MNASTLTESFAVVDDRSFSMGRANALALLFTIPLVTPLIGAYLWAHGSGSFGEGARLFFSLPVFLGSVAVGIVVHELIHGVAWAIAGRLPWSEITFGFQAKTLTPYAHARVPVPARVYRIGALMPGLLLGLAPALAALWTGTGAAFLFGVFMTAAAGGDLAIVWTLRGVEPGALVQDHPTRAGCHIVQRRPLKES